MKTKAPPGTQTFVLLLLIIFSLGFIGPGLFSLFYPLFGDTSLETIDLESIDNFYWITFFGQVALLVTGVFGFLRIFNLKFKEEIMVSPFQLKFLLGSIFGLIAVWFVVSGAEMLNQWILEQYPSSGFLEARDEMEEKFRGAFNASNKGYFPIALFVFGLLPAVGEELIFRGLLIKKLREASDGRTNFAVVVSSLLFAAIHMQPWNLLPMIILGLTLGYVYVFTKDIRYGIILHFLNNAVQISILFYWPEVMA